jgi:predicted transporter
MDYLGGYLTVGTLVGIALLSAKTGLGCGLSGLGRKEILGFAGIYAVAAFLLGGVAGVISRDISELVMASGILMHLIIASGLVFFGIQTRKNWISGKKDISRHTFLWLSLPCPACIAATFLACLVLADATGIAGFQIGALVGLIFFGGILLTSFGISYGAGKLGKKNPSTLGSSMIVLGLFYLLCPLIIPAYIDAQAIGPMDFTVPAGDVGVGLLLILLPVAAGYMTATLVRKRSDGGQ